MIRTHWHVCPGCDAEWEAEVEYDGEGIESAVICPTCEREFTGNDYAELFEKLMQQEATRVHV